MSGARRRRPAAVRYFGLSIFFGAILLATLVAQAFVGCADANAQARVNGAPEMSVLEYVGSAQFATDVAENWQSEFLQFVLMILATVWLVQRGSPESKDVDSAGTESDAEQKVGRFAVPGSPGWAVVGGWRRWVYSHSLTLSMGLFFLLSWGAQFVAGTSAYNSQRIQDLQAPISMGDYLLTPDFWNRTLQNWQSEFLAVGSMVVLSVFLRERGSAESKPVGEPHDSTGVTA
jgi:hypothetical protein